MASDSLPERKRLAGKTALVTGSTSGLGRAMADAFAAEGAHIVITGRNRPAAERAAAEIRAAGGYADFVIADLGEGVAAVLRLAEEATRVLGGRVDILVNNAGLIPIVTTADTDEATFDNVWTVNVKAAYFLTGVIAPAMKARGGGVVLNIGSINATYGFSASALYSATKAALHSLTRSWAAEYGPAGVRVNTIAPGLVQTEGTSGAHDRVVQMASASPASRPGRASEIGPLAVYLASDESSYVQGTVITLDGGWSTARN
jgi:NAD(P)-dependent dehydrogenase (short-subunit alcohol dehydrogenase family)